MPYDDYQIQYEPSEADEILKETTAALFKAAKENVEKLVLQTQLDNKMLKEQNRDLRQQVAAIRDRERKLTQKEADLANRAKRMPLKEFFGQRAVTMYSPEKKRQSLPPKCDLCNENRSRPYTTPLGRKNQEACPCSVATRKFEPQEITLTDLRKDRGTLLMWFKTFDNDGDHGYGSGRIVEDENIYTGSVPYDQLKGTIYFADKEQCQLYCDWLNAKYAE